MLDPLVDEVKEKADLKLLGVQVLHDCLLDFHRGHSALNDREPENRTELDDA